MVPVDFPHIAWAKRVPARHAHDLADSAVAPPDLTALGLPDAAGLGSVHRDEIDRLEAALGEYLGAPGGRVVVTAGGSEAIACAMAGLLAAGDEILVERPGYEPHRRVAPLFGVTVRTFDRPRAREFGDLAEVVQAAVGPRTRAVLFTSPHNPSGALLDERDAAALDRLAESRGLWLVCDEAFRAASDLPVGSAASRGPRWVSIGSLTKGHGLGGLRIGWVAATGAALAEATAAQNAFTGNPALPSVTLALALVPHLEALRARARGVLAENRARWVDAAERFAAHGLDPGPRSHGTTAWCLTPDDDSGDSFAAFAAERYDVAVTPGRFFGDSRGFRVGLGGLPTAFAPALERLERAWEAYARTTWRSTA